MISVKRNTSLRKITPHMGHYLLFMWVAANNKRKELFDSCIANIKSPEDYTLVTSIVNQAAKRCLEEFQDVYGDDLNEDHYEYDERQYEAVINKDLVN